MSEKATLRWRSGVIAMDDTTASYFFASRPGMMPSHSCFTSVQRTFISSHRELAISTSKPARLPSGLTKLYGGKVPSVAMRMTGSLAWAASRLPSSNSASSAFLVLYISSLLADLHGHCQGEVTGYELSIHTQRRLESPHL
ncbi:hypothetical protein D9M72_526410 [compost metagenome]